jgi:hypothetical protein
MDDHERQAEEWEPKTDIVADELEEDEGMTFQTVVEAVADMSRNLVIEQHTYMPLLKGASSS